MKFIIATNNAKKLVELERILSPLGIDAVSPKDAGVNLGDVDENGSTFKENSFIKAEAACRKTGLPAIADDSGICVDFLGGGPGIRYTEEDDPKPFGEIVRAILAAVKEMLIMWPIAMALELLFVGKLAQKLAFRFVTPGKDPMIMIILAISSMSVCLMCPLMSMAATILFKDAGNEFVAVWIQTTALNFPMALFWQIFFAGPLVRNVFGFVMKRIKQK